MSSLDGSSVTRLTTGLKEGQPNWQALTTDDALGDISGDIQDLEDGGSLTGGQGKSLTVKLDQINNRITAGRIQAALNLLQDFIDPEMEISHL